MLIKAVAIAAATSTVAAYSGQTSDLWERDGSIQALVERDASHTGSVAENDLLSRDVIYNDEYELFERAAEAEYLDNANLLEKRMSLARKFGKMRGLRAHPGPVFPFTNDPEPKDPPPPPPPAQQPQPTDAAGWVGFANNIATQNNVKRDLYEEFQDHNLRAREASPDADPFFSVVKDGAPLGLFDVRAPKSTPTQSPKDAAGWVGFANNIANQNNVKRDFYEDDLDYNIFKREAGPQYSTAKYPYPTPDPAVEYAREQAAIRKAVMLSRAQKQSSSSPQPATSSAPPKVKRDLFADELSYVYARDAEAYAYPGVPVPADQAHLPDSTKQKIHAAVMADRAKDAAQQAQPPTAAQLAPPANAPVAAKAPKAVPNNPKAPRDFYDDEDIYLFARDLYNDEDVFELFAREAEPDAYPGAPAPAPAPQSPALQAKIQAAVMADRAKEAAQKGLPVSQPAAVPAPAPKAPRDLLDNELVFDLFGRDAEPEADPEPIRTINRRPRGSPISDSASQFAPPPPPPPPPPPAPPVLDTNPQVQQFSGGLPVVSNQRRDLEFDEYSPFNLFTRDAEAEPKGGRLRRVGHAVGGAFTQVAGAIGNQMLDTMNPQAATQSAAQAAAQAVAQAPAYTNNQRREVDFDEDHSFALYARDAEAEAVPSFASSTDVNPKVDTSVVRPESHLARGNANRTPVANAADPYIVNRIPVQRTDNSAVSAAGQITGQNLPPQPAQAQPQEPDHYRYQDRSKGEKEHRREREYRREKEHRDEREHRNKKSVNTCSVDYSSSKDTKETSTNNKSVNSYGTGAAKDPSQIQSNARVSSAANRPRVDLSTDSNARGTTARYNDGAKSNQNTERVNTARVSTPLQDTTKSVNDNRRNDVSYKGYKRDISFSGEDDFPFALYERDAEAEAQDSLAAYKAHLAGIQDPYAHLRGPEQNAPKPTVHARDVDGGSVSFSKDWFERDALPEIDVELSELVSLAARDAEAESSNLFERDDDGDDAIFERDDDGDDGIFGREAEPEWGMYEALSEPEIWF